MAHIADCLFDSSSGLGLNNYIARELSPPRPRDIKPETPPPEDHSLEKEKFVWRMNQQPAESRKFQLFPGKEKLSLTTGRKSPDLGSCSPGGQMGSVDRILGAALRIKSKDQPLVRRRKVSVPELGPMTTVQEVSMDSPTIPGRPPFHERSASVPGNTWRQHIFGESISHLVSGPALDESAEMTLSDCANSRYQISDQSRNATPQPQNATSHRPPLSPKSLAPLMIPPSSGPPPRLAGLSLGNSGLGDETPGPDVPPKSARMLDFSPYLKGSTFKSSSTSTLVAGSIPDPITKAPSHCRSRSAQPNSAPAGRSSPQPWSAATNPIDYVQTCFEATSSPRHRFGHQRGASEDNSMIMDRGRPKKRIDGTPLKPKRLPQSVTDIKTITEEWKAFEALPQGSTPTNASASMPVTEIEMIRNQAIGQASRFEVLNSRDVDILSRELRALDERCSYLRKTHRSLRSGRRSLHHRICSYLRSPRTAKFTHDSLLKQEEALSDLDASIDDWLTKLEKAENRRTRVRQKLLEHVAAALIIQPQDRAESDRDWCAQEVQGIVVSGQQTPPRSPTKSGYTPPRSPTKSDSPARLAEPIQASTPEPVMRGDVESIRIYADSDVYDLLADVEDEINRMGERQKINTTHEQSDDIHLSEETERAIEAGMTLNAVAFEGLTGTPIKTQRQQS